MTTLTSGLLPGSMVRLGQLAAGSWFNCFLGGRGTEPVTWQGGPHQACRPAFFSNQCDALVHLQARPPITRAESIIARRMVAGLRAPSASPSSFPFSTRQWVA